MKHLILTAVLLLGSTAQGAAFFKERPSNQVPKKEALTLMLDERSVYRCRQVRVGANINPTKVPGSQDTYHTALPSSEISGLEALKFMNSGGRSAFSCDAVGISDAGRVRKL
jgi:hypothetical protein